MSHESDGNNAFKIELSNSPPGFEREQSLASKFDDLSPGDLANQAMGSQSGEAQPLIFEVTEAVKSLVEEVKDSKGKKNSFLSNPPPKPAPNEITLPTFGLQTQSMEMTGMGVSKIPTQFQKESSQSYAIDYVSLELKMIEDFCTLFLCQKSFGDLCQDILENFVRAVGVESGAILELDSDTEELFFRASYGGAQADQLDSFRIPAKTGVAGIAIEQGKPIIINDLEKDQVQIRSVGVTTGFQPKTVLAAPIYIDDRVYGVIELFNKEEGLLFSEQDTYTIAKGIKVAAKILEERFLIAELIRRGKK